MEMITITNNENKKSIELSENDFIELRISLLRSAESLKDKGLNALAREDEEIYNKLLGGLN